MKHPLSTYRLQLNSGFQFDAASVAAEYLARLGISHVYCSPYLQATPGSSHGYDVVDHHRVNADLGGEQAHNRFCQRLGELKLGQVVDIVPNHMAAAGRYNAWWWDIMENGPASRYAPYFDIDWNPPEEKLRNKVLLPVLGDRYGRVLAAGELKLKREGGGFLIRYYDHEFPASPRSIGPLLQKAAVAASSEYLAFLADGFSTLPSSHSTDWPSVLARHRDKTVLRELLAKLCEEQPEIAARIDECVAALNANIDDLDTLMGQQNFRVSYWRVAERELVYRRFFDVNHLIGLRMENPAVFDDTHALVIEWLRRGVIDGLRVDHPDGLRDPQGYLERLRRAAPDAWIIVEKILMPGENLRDSWPVQGTSGYDFLNAAGRLFTDPRGEAAINEIYREFTGATLDWTAVMHEKKVQVLTDLLGSDVNRLTALFLQICEQDRDHRDYTRHEIHEAVREAAASFPVYRTYVQAETGVITREDEEFIRNAMEIARARRPDLDPELFAFLRQVLTLQAGGALGAEFVMLFQQLTGPAMAKGVEDTAFYSYLRLASQNEVGGSPGRFSSTLDEFHQFCAHSSEHWPLTMLTTSTHDTKRGEDVRLRIAQLTFNAREWSDAVKRWAAANERHKTNRMPDHKTEYLLYQTLVGAWPISNQRLAEYMRKAAREAKEITSWIAPEENFEQALMSFIDGILSDTEFLWDFEAFLAPVVRRARLASLAHTLLKLTAPGVPDIYQGTELWDLNLVDPDNRRPVDFTLRARLLDELDALSLEQILGRFDDALPKLYTIRQCLRVRNERPHNFSARGNYRALWATGPRSADVVAFGRGGDVISVAPRRFEEGADGWDRTLIELPPGEWKNRFTCETIAGGKVSLHRLLEHFPVALLTLGRSPA